MNRGASGGLVARALYYLWRVFSNLVQIGIVLLVFFNLDDPQTIIIVGVLGVIYATIRNGLIMQALMQVQITNAVADELMRVRTLLNDPSEFSQWWGEKVDREEVVSQYKKRMVSAWIDAGSLSIVGLICLFNVFVNL